MEAHFLEGFVEGKPGFKAEPWYNPHGDCLEYVLAHEGTVADRIDEVITIYRSLVDRRAVGFQIKGVTALIAGNGPVVQICYTQTKDRLKKVGVKFGDAITLALKKSLGEPLASTRLDKYAEFFDVVKSVELDADAELCLPAGADR